MISLGSRRHSIFEDSDSTCCGNFFPLGSAERSERSLASAFSLLLNGLVALAAPIGVLTVNVLGSFIFGLIVGLAKQPGGIVTPLEKTLLVGVLGGFTTFSTFAFDAVTMLESGRMLTAFLFIVGSNVGAILGMWLGIRLMSV